jgi:formyltetrahydrofolate-dependent phosphoribosylglycinamide formyltransferase
MKLLELAVFASGRGSNFQAIYNAIQKGQLNARVKVVISNNADAGALDFARQHQVPAVHLSGKNYKNKTEFDDALLGILGQYETNFIVLAGYMKLIRPKIIQAFRHRILNIHPALLPAFGGKGMYGHLVHEGVLNYGCKVSGVTVHVVDEEYDHGPIVKQACVPVEENDTPDTLAARILKVEHQIYTESIQLFAEERVVVKNGRTFIKDKSK